MRGDRGRLIFSSIVGGLAFLLTALSVAKRRRREKEEGAEISPVPFRRYFLVFLLGTLGTFVITHLVLPPSSSPAPSMVAGGGAEAAAAAGPGPGLEGGKDGEDVLRQALTYIRSDPPPF